MDRSIINDTGWRLCGHGLDGRRYLKTDALLFEEADAALDDAARQFHGGDAVLEQAADGVVALEHGHRVAGLVQLVGAGQTGRTRTDHGHLYQENQSTTSTR